jgi:regulator of protease activity HflC (stomatin/prohibitin superfamily)
MDKKSELNTELAKHLKEKLAPYGIVVESASLPRTEPDKAIKTAITERSKRAQEVEEAKQKQEKAKIEAETKRIEAKGEADAAIERARGEAEANEILSKSLTENLLKQQELEARQKHGWVTIQGANTVVKD